ncbi:TetR/AcrR family transcriptional regulator [Streptomyces sp. NBC_01498]|uniref:TetR/AcrR family transcriptional regulator n=1 Tax=Streptomyces sp. NBC_01498 TaxID=2975870 RepID=UPI002E7BD82A|nr:TetR/AcrR family transcriptional regulator [Streptomyces sp. NBC_01498]WTL25503.1 TetR/AcrR family transcriptional regulator [Streptomyces sp. NBC_01498]
MTASSTDGRIARGNQTRQLILKHTVRIASVEGLGGLSLGRLAAELELSKSGVFALFGSKEELQLATVRAAAEVYADHVVRPVRDMPPGLARVRRLCDGWLDYSRSRVFPGGCFFHSVAAEYDARRGRVHDAVARERRDWVAFVRGTVEDARGAGEIAPDTDVAQLTFELISLLEGADAESVLHDDFSCYARAARAVLDRLRAVATDPALLPPAPP